MTVKETAEYLRIPLPTVYYLVQRGQLPAIQIGGRWRDVRRHRHGKRMLTRRRNGRQGAMRFRNSSNEADAMGQGGRLYLCPQIG